MHDSKAIFLALTAENKSTETVGADPGFRGEAGGDARGKQGYWICPPQQGCPRYGPSGSGAEPQPLCNSCTFKVAYLSQEKNA